MNHPKMKYTYVGVDSHKDTHCVVILNCFYEKLGEFTALNTPNSFENFILELETYKQKGTSIIIGLEDVTQYGRALTSYLINKKYKVKHVNSILVASERKSMNVLSKTDSLDAECAARVLINRFDTLPDADPQDKFWVLSQMVTRRRSLVKINITLKNHLQSYIVSHYPSYHEFFTNIDCKSALAFYEKYPSPSKLLGVSIEQLEGFLKDISSGKQYKGKAEIILECIERDGDTTADFQEIKDLAVKSTINQINNNLKEVESIDNILEEFLEKFDYNLESMKGIDTVTAANLIAEIGDISRFSTPAKLAKYAGIAPVTYSSGKSDVQFSNGLGNRTLNSIFFRLAVMVTMTAGKNRRIINPIFYDYYQKKISEGKTKKQALKCVERRLVNIIWGMLKYKREYVNPPSIDYPKTEENIS